KTLFTAGKVLAATVQTVMAAPLFEGVRDADQNAIQKKFGSQLQNIQPHTADQLVKFLMQTGHYSSVAVFADASGNTILSAKSYRRVGSIKFEGLKVLGEIEALNALAIKPG